MTDPTFDVDAWLEAAAPPQRSVRVYGRGDLVAQLQDAARALTDATDATDQRLGGDPRAAERDALRAELEASARTIHVRAILFAERNALVEQFTTPATASTPETWDSLGYEEAAVALCAVQPALTRAQVSQLHTRLGEAQWALLTNAINEASAEPIDVPLSRLGSESTQAS